MLTKQLQLLEAKYDLIIVDTNYLSNALTKLSLINSQKIIAVCDSNNFSSGQLQKILTFVRKNQTDNPSLKLSTIILNNYNPDIHIDPLLNIAKMVGTNCLFITLPFRSELQKIDQQSVKFIKNNQWDDYTLMLNKVVKQLMKDI